MDAQPATTNVSYIGLLRNPRFALILLITATATLGSILPPALPGLAAGLGVTEGRVAYVITAFKIPSILIVPVAAVIADTYGRRRVLLPSLLIFAVAGGAMFFLASFSTVLLVALIVGVGWAALFPLTVTLLGDFFEGEWNAAAQGLRVAIIGICIVAVPAATGYLAELRWNYPFLLFFLGLPVFVLVFALLAEPMEGRSSSRDFATTFTGYTAAIRSQLASPALAILVCGGYTRGFSTYALLTFVPLFAVSVLGASLFEAGLLLSLRGIIYVIVAPFAGTIVARFSRKHVLFVSLLVCAFALLSLPFAAHLRSLGLIVAVHAAGDAMFDPVNKGTVTTMARREYRAGIVNALYVLKRIGQASSPAVCGMVLVMFGYHELFIAAGTFVIAYLVLFAAWFSYEPVA